MMSTNPKTSGAGKFAERLAWLQGFLATFPVPTRFEIRTPIYLLDDAEAVLEDDAARIGCYLETNASREAKFQQEWPIEQLESVAP